MPLIYKVQTKDGIPTNKKSPINLVKPITTLCKISTKNLMAFCSYKNFRSQIYVCDIFAPWQCYEICTTNNVVTVIEWNQSSELLLLAYEHGSIELWSMRNNCLNNWFMAYTVSVSNENILKARFFHTKYDNFFSVQKKDLVLYNEKFERLEQAGTLIGFGKVPMDGCLLITVSGLLIAVVIARLLTSNETNGQPTELSATTHKMTNMSKFIKHSSITYCPTGCFNVAFIPENDTIALSFKIKMCLNSKSALEISNNKMPLLYLNPMDTTRKYIIKEISWNTINCGEFIFITFDGLDGCYIELWNLIKRHQVINNLLLSNKNDFVQIELWDRISKVNLSGNFSYMWFSKLLTETLTIFTILKDNSIQTLEFNLKKLSLATFERMDDSIYNGRLIIGDVTYLNQILISFDVYGQMYALQLPISNHYDTGHYKINQLSLSVALLEYSILSGIDAGDVLLLNSANMDLLVEKLTESFTRQVANVRHFFYSRFLSLKSNMIRIQTFHSDFDNLVFLHFISILFKSLLRPTEVGSQDKASGEKLTIVLNEIIPDIDKVLRNLDGKDFAVDSLTLQSLQPLIQWVADLALNIIVKLPKNLSLRIYKKKICYSIHRDMIAIGSIRELLVIIRIWSLLNPNSQPVFLKSMDNLDIISITFHLLTRLMQNHNDSDETLLDECDILSAQVFQTNKCRDAPITLLGSHPATKKFPLIFNMFEIPKIFSYKIKEDIDPFSFNVICDDISNTYLCADNKSVRSCMRCGLVNNVDNVNKTAAMKIWFQRWSFCHCGGLWEVIK